MSSRKTFQVPSYSFDLSTTLLWLLGAVVLIFIIYSLWWYFFKTNVVYDKNPPNGSVGSVNSGNFSVPGTCLKLDVNVPMHALDVPINDNEVYFFYYLPPGKNDGDVITLLLNSPFNTSIYPQNIQVWFDQAKTTDASYNSDVWYPFTASYNGNSLNTGAIARAIWYSGAWYLSTNSVNSNT